MKNLKFKTILKRLSATAMAIVIMGGSVTVQKAEEIQTPETGQNAAIASLEEDESGIDAQSGTEALVVSMYPNGKSSRTVYPDTGVTLTGTALIESGILHRKCEWSATISGSMSDAYTTAACSFGYGGKVDNQMGKSYFTLYKKSFSANAKVANNCGNAITKLYY